jgi:hypothetical protein
LVDMLEDEKALVTIEGDATSDVRDRDERHQ